MVRTHADKEKRREERLKKLPTSERAYKMAVIKKKEGRPLSSEERHALRMNGFLGTIYQLANDIRQPVEEETRFKAIDQVLELLQNEFAKYARSPQTSRIIQSCIRCGSPRHLEIVTTLLSNEDAIPLLFDPCACHTVCCLLRHTTAGLFTTFWKSTLLPNAHKMVEYQPGLMVLSAAVNSPYCNTSKKGELVFFSLVAPEEAKRLQSDLERQVKIGEEKDGHILPWMQWPQSCTSPPSPLLQERLKSRCEKIVNKKACDLTFSHLLLDTALMAYDAVSMNPSQPLGAVDMPEWKSDIIVAVREVITSCHLVTLGIPSARIALRAFLDSSPKEKRNMLQSMTDHAVRYASTASGAAFFCAVLDLNADTQVTHRYITSAWTERLDDLCVPSALRNFSKLVHRISMVNIDAKNKAIPQLWKDALDLNHTKFAKSSGTSNWEEIAVRHRRLASRLLVHFIPFVIENVSNVGSVKSGSTENSGPLFSGPSRRSLMGIFHQIPLLLQTVECDAQLKEYCAKDLQYQAFSKMLALSVKSKQNAGNSKKEAQNTDPTSGKVVSRKRKVGEITEVTQEGIGSRTCFDSDEDEDGNEEKVVQVKNEKTLRQVKRQRSENESDPTLNVNSKKKIKKPKV